MRPLYGSFAWAYELIVSAPGGPALESTVAAFGRRLPPGARVVDVGCGAGSYSEALAHGGFEVTGLDLSNALLERAHARAPDVSFVVADLREWAPEEPFDGVLCRGMLNDFVSDDDRRAALAALRRVLRPGGVAVLDARPWRESVAHYSEKGEHRIVVDTPRGRLEFESRTAPRWDTGPGPLSHSRELHVEERYSLGDRVETFSFVMRCWEPDELRDGLLAAGFSTVELPATDLQPARPDRMVAVATA